ncbi:unnamed protein product [Effrenium voratum]|nr:unnamed protein product [Effrenium voratum]
MVDVSRATPKEQREALQEGQLLASLKHPYVVRYRESFTESGWFCLLMDYCEGGDLTKQIDNARRKRQNIPEEQVLRWFTQAVLALKYIHERHVLHRDLKPGNFFISKAGCLKMGDFGIAKVLSCTLACARTQIGTPYYLSPEVCEEEPYAWPSDIWAMGCILYELCALKVPFEGPNIHRLVQKILTGTVPVLPGSYSEFLRRLCSEMLDRMPGQRPSADDILKQPEIQTVVKQMLEEASTPDAKAEPLAKVFKLGDLVEYHSSTHNDWLPATVLKDDASGRIIIDLKPNTWMTAEEQAQKIRPRKVEPKPRSSAYPRSGSQPAIARVQSQEKAKAEGGMFPDIRRSDKARLERAPSSSNVIQRSPSAPAAPVRSRSRSASAAREAAAAPRRLGRVGSRPSSRAQSPMEGETPKSLFRNRSGSRVA